MGPLAIGAIMIGGSALYAVAARAALKVKVEQLTSYTDAYFLAQTDEERASIKAACVKKLKIDPGDFDMLIVQLRAKRAAEESGHPRNPISFERTS